MLGFPEGDESEPKGLSRIYKNMLGFPEGDESEPKGLSRIYKICWGFLREMKVSQCV